MAIYMRIGPRGGDDGAITIVGSVTQEDHVDWIAVEGMDFAALTNDDDKDDGSANRQTNQPKGAGSQSDHGVTLTKLHDYSTTGLLEWANTRERYDVKIDCSRESGQVFMSFLLEDATLTAFSSVANKESVTETVTLQYKRMTIESTSFDKMGNPLAQTAATTQAHERFSRVSTSVVGTAGGGADEEGAMSGSASAASTAVAGGGGLSGEGGSSALASSGIAQETVDPTFDGLALASESIQEDRELLIDPISSIAFELESFEGCEEISRPFEFVLQVISEDMNVAVDSVVGQEVSFRLANHQDNEDNEFLNKREFHGICREFLVGPVLDGARRYTIVVVPKLWTLQQRTNCRIFQPDKTLKEITSTLLEEHGITSSDYDDSKASAGDVVIPYCVQYRESDFAFLSRLWEEAGLFYFFEFAQGSHRMVLADSKAAYLQADPGSLDQSSGSVDGPQVRGWSKRYRMVPGKATFRDHNFTTPTETLEADVDSVVTGIGNDAFEVYDYPGRYADVTAGRERAKVRVEQEEATHCLVEATSTCDWLFAGSKFKIAKHDDTNEQGAEYAVIRLRHSAKQLPSDVKARIRYTNKFFAIPKETTFRPTCATPKPLISGPQTAVVVGTSGEEIETDEYGRVKVQFHWDREGNSDENSSLWIRCAQTGAGSRFGTMLIPRIGWEVVVEFEEGDPDRPLVTGCVYNADRMPPYDLPDGKTITGLKTRSTLEGTADNANELYFDDAAGEELVYFHAEKNFERVVELDDTLHVGTDAEGSQSITIEKDQTVDVLHGDRTITIGEGGDNLTISQGDRTVELSQGSETVTLSSGDRTITLTSGSQTTEAAGGEVNTEAGMGIELKVGESSVKIDQEGVTIKGLKVEIEGTTKAEMKGLMCEVKGDGQMKVGGGITMIG